MVFSDSRNSRLIDGQTRNPAEFRLRNRDEGLWWTFACTVVVVVAFSRPPKRDEESFFPTDRPTFFLVLPRHEKCRFLRQFDPPSLMKIKGPKTADLIFVFVFLPGTTFHSRRERRFPLVEFLPALRNVCRKCTDDSADRERRSLERSFERSNTFHWRSHQHEICAPARPTYPSERRPRPNAARRGRLKRRPNQHQNGRGRDYACITRLFLPCSSTLRGPISVYS